MGALHGCRMTYGLPHFFPQGLTVLNLVAAHPKSSLSSLVFPKAPSLAHFSLYCTPLTLSTSHHNMAL